MPDDPRWDRLIHLVGDALPADEAAALREWIALDPARQHALAQLEELWRATAPVGDARPTSWDADAELRRIRAETGGMGRVIARVGPGVKFDGIGGGRRARAGSLVRIAAAIVLTIGGGLLWRWHAPSRVASSAAATSEFRTAPGQQLSLGLPDGTRVVLAPGSVLRRSADYGVHRRTVYLEGEAYFSVRHDARRPFAVYTRHAVARDLGTRFVVRAYGEDASTDVAVAEGLVAVAPAAPAPGDSVLVRPQDLARIAADGHVTLTHAVPSTPYFDWTGGTLAFQATPLHDVVQRLQRWYGIDIRIADPAIRDYRVTVTFQKEDPAEAVDVVATALQLEVSRAGQAYIFTRKRR